MVEIHPMVKYANTKSDLVQFCKKTTFFIIAFIPLWAIILVNYNLTKGFNWYLIIGSTVFIISLVVALTLYLEKLRKETKEPHYFKIVEKTNVTHEVVFYILGYIPSVLLTTFQWNEVITFAIVLLTIYVLYIKTNMVHINPILALRYKMYKATDDHDNTVVFLSKLNLRTGIEVQYSEISDNINMVRNSDG